MDNYDQNTLYACIEFSKKFSKKIENTFFKIGASYVAVAWISVCM